jgi:CHASE2 domain-containing sensor protein
MTEKLTLAWLTPTARRLRALFKACWGPYGILLAQSQTRRGFYANLALEAGSNLIAIGFVSLVWHHLLWLPIPLLSILAGSIIVFISYPCIEF